MAASLKVENAVRAYLASLQNGPRKTVGRPPSAASKDPLVHLRALAQADRSNGLEADFITNAAKFAEAEGTTTSAWQQIGVPDDVLRKAGLLKGTATKTTATRAPRKAKKKAARSARLDLDQVSAKLPRKQFKVRDLAERIERPVPTTRNYLDRLVEAKKVKIVGEDKTGRGKPAKIYQRA